MRTTEPSSTEGYSTSACGTGAYARPGMLPPLCCTPEPATWPRGGAAAPGPCRHPGSNSSARPPPRPGSWPSSGSSSRNNRHKAETLLPKAVLVHPDEESSSTGCVLGTYSSLTEPFHIRWSGPRSRSFGARGVADGQMLDAVDAG